VLSDMILSVIPYLEGLCRTFVTKLCLRSSHVQVAGDRRQFRLAVPRDELVCSRMFMLPLFVAHGP
jgi:hypothetical protein